jgi:tRNA (mo5U34)-methyltransferase
MNLDDAREAVEKINWYHEFDFPGGLSARKRDASLAKAHRKLWRFIETQLDQIEFTGKTVLDLGCWDGYWSFYAERRGARHVLATDDRTQNRTQSAGLLLAKELFNSSIETRLDVSVYEAAKLNEKFDIILCMGIYYHLVDPFHAFSQVRHCCHQDSIVVFEGEVTDGLRPNTMFYDLSRHFSPYNAVFVPTVRVLNQMLEAAYFEVVSQVKMFSRAPLNWRKRLRIYRQAMRNTIEPPARPNRIVTVCRPKLGRNELHRYRPPFGLHRYDDRFNEA